MNVFLKVTCTHSELIICGDYNLVLDPIMDRSSSTPKPSTLSARALTEELLDLSSRNVWQEWHKSQYEYTVASTLICTTAIRIVAFFIHAAKTHFVSSCEYLAKTHSVHAPLLLQTAIKDSHMNYKCWRFPSHLINDIDFIKLINELLDWYLTTNKNPASRGILNFNIPAQPCPILKIKN